ncbi:MAG: hypothetical protein H0Z53_00765 [Nitrosospira sp.]|nr:hypothetical protein [Nitrosospira sp.]
MSNKKQIPPVAPGIDVEFADSVDVLSGAEDSDLLRAITTDDHAGKGGSYTYDPATGQRTRNQDSA